MPGAGVPIALGSNQSGANAPLDSGAVPVHLTTGILAVELGASAVVVWSGASITDENGSPVCDLTGINGNALFVLLGDVDGVPVVLAMSGSAPLLFQSRAFLGGKGSRRPRSLRIQIPALGAGVTSGYAVIGEPT